MERKCICQIDVMGRITLPREIRTQLGWKRLNFLSLEIEENTLILRLSEKDLPRDGVLYPVDGFV